MQEALTDAVQQEKPSHSRLKITDCTEVPVFLGAQGRVGQQMSRSHRRSFRISGAAEKDMFVVSPRIQDPSASQSDI